MDAHKQTIEILSKIASKYNLNKLEDILVNSDTLLFEKDIYITLMNIVEAAGCEGAALESLKEVKNIYGSPVFMISADNYNIKNPPDFEKAIDELEDYSFCFELSPYHIVNTYLAILVAQVIGTNLKKLCSMAMGHIQESIEVSLKNNPNWNEDKLSTDNPVLVMPVGAAGCGKSTFYKELSNVLNISCDNIRYLLFKEYGPCFSAWESALSWWVVNYLTDYYLEKRYSVFYNGVNTDMEYRAPITMENTDPVFAGIPYAVRLVYFAPVVDLNEQEIEEMKSVNLWKTSIDEIDLSGLSEPVGRIIEMIKRNYHRTLNRTKEISEGKSKQDPFDVLYAVPAPVIKLFVEQSFKKPEVDNITVVERKIIEDPQDRQAFYKQYALKVMDQS
ncbi:hypothetical protein ACFLUV_05525 [Elusimicrobiota bacterium]